MPRYVEEQKPLVPVLSPQQEALARIFTLENTFQPRAIREAILKGDKTYLQQIENEIAELRKVFDNNQAVS